MQDTKHRDLGMLLFPSAEWQALLNSTQLRTSKEA